LALGIGLPWQAAEMERVVSEGADWGTLLQVLTFFCFWLKCPKRE
jgi:hypothetical protein